MKKTTLLLLSSALFVGACSHHRLDCSDESCASCDQCGDKPCLTLNAQDKLSHFAFDSYALTNLDRQQLDAVIAYLKQHPDKMVVINGYTDSTGSSAYNEKLSRQRAEAVSAYLEKQGISSQRITTRGYGASHFTASNDTAAGRAQNRRAVVVIE